MKHLTKWLTVAILIFHSTWSIAASKVKVTIEVVDEAGQPVAGATVSINTYLPDGYQLIKGITDDQGRWTAQARAVDRLGGFVQKDGYYENGYLILLYELVPEGVTVGRKFPDVTHRVMIRPKVKPVPMFAYALSRAIPVEGEEIGLDLLKADWVAPHGKGEVADVLIKIDRSDSPPQFGKFSWRFPRKGDGMVRVRPEDCYPDSELVMPRLAPKDGYIFSWQSNWETVEGKRVAEVKPAGPPLSSIPYFIRIRTQMDEKGRVVKALYGKIIKGNYSIKWSTADRRILFTYYLNPDGTRNMEFDPERNLFKDILPYQERHKLPKWP